MSDSPLETDLRRRASRGTGRRPSAGWTQEASARILTLRDRLPNVTGKGQAQVADLLNEAAELVDAQVGFWRLSSRLVNWWNGGRVERTWACLHLAEILMVEHADHRGLELALEDAYFYADVLTPDEAVRKRYDDYVTGLEKPKAKPTTEAEPKPKVGAVAPHTPSVAAKQEGLKDLPQAYIPGPKPAPKPPEHDEPKKPQGGGEHGS